MSLDRWVGELDSCGGGDCGDCGDCGDGWVVTIEAIELFLECFPFERVRFLFIFVLEGV